ncbi:MAG: phage holin family protein [Caulobacterales bacterium]|jgi:putative membrane protein
MVSFIIRALVIALGLWVASKVVPGVHVRDLRNLLEAGFLLGLVNAFVRPVITLLTLPLTIITLGLFLLVVNALMVTIVTWLIHGFVVHGFLAAVMTTIIVWLTSVVASWFIGDPRDNRR